MSPIGTSMCGGAGRGAVSLGRDGPGCARGRGGSARPAASTGEGGDKNSRDGEWSASAGGGDCASGMPEEGAVCREAGGATAICGRDSRPKDEEATAFSGAARGSAVGGGASVRAARPKGAEGSCWSWGGMESSGDTVTAIGPPGSSRVRWREAQTVQVEALKSHFGTDGGGRKWCNDS